MTSTAQITTENETPTPLSGAEKEKIYKTTYKKNNIIGDFCFIHRGDLITAVEAVKAYLDKKHLKHIHTVPFLVDLNEEIHHEL